MTARKRRAPAKTGDRLVGMARAGGVVGGGSTFAAVFHLRPWQDASGGTHQEPLRVELAVRSQASGSAAITRWQGKVVAFTVTEARAGGANRSPSVATKRLRAGRMEVEAAVPVVIVDRLLGRLTLDPDLGALMGHRKTSRHDYEVMFDVAADASAADVRQSVQGGRETVRRLECELPGLRQACADALLELHNDVWNAGLPTTRRDFVRALSVASVHVQTRRITVYLRSDELFGDHGVEVRLSPAGDVREILVS